jgi:hypothetical protein
VSRALADFEVSLQQAESLIRLESGYADPPPPTDQDAVLGLRGGATVLLCATFERYVRDMVSEHLELLATAPPPVPFDDLPAKLRTSSVWKSIERAMKGRLEPEVRGREARLPAVARSALTIVEGLIDPIALSDTGGNPSADQIRDICGDIGLTDPFAAMRTDFDAMWETEESADFLSQKLDEIVNARHRVAHRADALQISRAQLSEWPRFLRALARVLDWLIEGYVLELIVAGTTVRPSSNRPGVAGV